MVVRCLSIGLVFLAAFLTARCSSQEQPEEDTEEALLNRKPAVAGRFYPANGQELNNTLISLFEKAAPPLSKEVRALISPHAGYVFSGEVAASAFNQIDPDRSFERIFVIGSSHTAHFEGASIYIAGHYETPLGEAPVDLALAKELVSNHTVFHYLPKAHISEHSIEVQLPFIQRRIKAGYAIVPIIIGTQNPEVVKEIAGILKPWFNSRNLFVISSDFSHYPAYADAVEIDNLAAEAILSNSPDAFVQVMTDDRNKRVKGLSTRCCGWSSVLTLLYMTHGESEWEYLHLQYKNSGDSEYGEQDRVVGYHAMAVVSGGREDSRMLNDKDKQILLGLARKTIVDYVGSGSTEPLNASQFPENLHVNRGAFVTLHMQGKLRGCIGRFTSDEPLFKVVQQMAIASATQDTRFMPVMEYEIPDIEIEISVLTPMKKINSPDQVELGKHGIYIVKGGRTGVFLPQVATETGWTLEEYLGHCSRDKAGIGWLGWKEADIFTFEALVFSEKEME